MNITNITRIQEVEGFHDAGVWGVVCKVHGSKMRIPSEFSGVAMPQGTTKFLTRALHISNIKNVMLFASGQPYAFLSEVKGLLYLRSVHCIAVK